MSEYIINWDENLVADTFSKNSLREEIIRCRDCRHYDKDDAGCMHFVLTSNKLLHVKNHDGFCAWGERRSE